MGILSHRLTGRLTLCKLFFQQCVIGLDPWVKAEKVRLEETDPFCSNEIIKYCQMPVVPLLSGDKWVSLFLPNTAVRLGYVRLVSLLLQS